MLGVASDMAENNINSVTISPKRGFNVINIWNENYSKANGSIKILSKLIEPGEIRYTKHVDKKFN